MAAVELFSTSLFSDPNLIAYYRAENLNDSIGGFTLTDHNTVAFNAAKFNNGFDFGASNTNKYLSKASNLGLAGNHDVSVSFWIKLQTEIASGTYQFVRHDSTLTASRYFYCGYDYNGGTIRLHFENSGVGTFYTTSLGTSGFHHIVMVRNNTGSNSLIYLDGASVATGSLGTDATGNPDTFGIGADPSSASNFSSAIMDDVAIFNRVLTATEIASIFTGPVAAVRSGDFKFL